MVLITWIKWYSLTVQDCMSHCTRKFILLKTQKRGGDAIMKYLYLHEYLNCTFTALLFSEGGDCRGRIYQTLLLSIMFNITFSSTL
jgi:hypothetical protein